MANTILTPTAVTRKALQVLHQKLTFVGAVNQGAGTLSTSNVKSVPTPFTFDIVPVYLEIAGDAR